MLDDLKAWEAKPPKGAPRLLVVSTGLALLLAMDVPGGRFFRTIFYLPNVLAEDTWDLHKILL